MRAIRIKKRRSGCTGPAGRLYSVSFSVIADDVSGSAPPGGCAYLHRHQGPGIRCLVEGGIRIDTHGRSTSYGPGGAWYESGPELRKVIAITRNAPTDFRA